jgi:hypothetical protein
MNRGCVFVSIAALALAFGCGSSTDEKGNEGDSQAAAPVACPGATSGVLHGSCTYMAYGMTTCWEDYYNSPPSGTELDTYQKACSKSGFTFSATDPCPTANVACRCVDSSGSFKRIKYGYGTYADACGTCTGDCYSKL